MGEVYLAYDPKLDREVAVKVLLNKWAGNPEFLARFEKEANTIAGLEHAAIVPVYDIGQEGGQPYLVMRYMTGGSLQERLGSISLNDIDHVLTRIASALDKAHQNGIIHRDIKPGNILFDAEGEPYLADFGIACTIISGPVSGSGTRWYMAPEQRRGGILDARTDVYQLGVTLYQMLTGKLPKAGSIPSVLDAHPHLPPAIDEVIARALAEKKEQRYPTASELASAFSEGLKGSAALLPPEKFRLPFANREIEKGLIRKLLDSNFYVQIEAPSGLGKSYLIAEIQKQFKAEGSPTVRIDFDREHRDCIASRFGFLQAFSEQLDLTQIKNVSETSLLEQIGHHLADKNQVVLFIDHADLGAPSLVSWVRGTFLHCLATDWKVPIRVLAAGQQIIPEWRGVKRGRPFKAFPLSHFDDSLVIEEIINHVVKRFGEWDPQDTMSDEEWEPHLETMVDGLLSISCGHPLVMAEVLRYTAETDNFMQATFFTEKWTELCDRCLAPVVDGRILFGLERNVRQAFRSLCIFRYVWPTLILQLTAPDISEELGAAWEPFSEGRRGWRTWWSRVEDTYLIDNPKTRRLYRISPVIRQVIALVLRAEDETRYHARNRRARQIYKKLLNNQKTASTQRAACMLELFYHMTQAGARSIAATTFTQILTDFLNSLSKEESINVAPHLLDWLREDTELEKAIDQTVPGLYHQLIKQVYHVKEGQPK